MSLARASSLQTTVASRPRGWRWIPAYRSVVSSTGGILRAAVALATGVGTSGPPSEFVTELPFGGFCCVGHRG